MSMADSAISDELTCGVAGPARHIAQGEDTPESYRPFLASTALRGPAMMDQIGQKQKAKRANRVKPRPKDGKRPREIPLHRDLFGGSDPGTSARRRQSTGRR